MKKTSVKIKTIAAILAAVCTVSAGAAVTVSALSDNIDTNTAVSVKKAENFEIVLKGCDWNYSADRLNAVISCDFDYATKTAKFIATGKTKGVTNAVFKTKNDDGTWNHFEVKLIVDDNLNVSTETEVKTELPAEKETSKPDTDEKKAEIKTGKPCTMDFYGCDWNYSADSLNAKITCEFDYTAKTATFIATGVKAGTTNAVLKLKNADGKWYHVTVIFTVDDNLDVTGKVTDISLL